MAFQFSLAAVLRYRDGLEQREHLALEKLQQEVSLLEAKVTQIEHDCLSNTINRSAELAQGIRAINLQSAYEYQSALERQRDILQSQLQEARLKWQRQLQVYQTARRRRETLEKLRSQQLDAYRREQARREQNTLDDIFLSRRARRD
jgi:flagellar export protein FliJ